MRLEGTMKETRLQELKNYIKSLRNVSNEELCKEMNVSMSTLRRDLQVLQDEGFIRKVYGGVAYNDTSMLTSFQYRTGQEPEGKNAVGQLAARLIEDEDTIFVDSGTTTPYILNYITAHNVTVLTNNAAILAAASDFPQLDIYALPGLFYSETMSFFSPEAIDLLSTFKIDKAFLAASGFSYRGATNNAAYEYTLKKYVAEHIDNAYLCISVNKFDISRVITYCSPEDLKGIVTDQKPRDEIVRMLLEKGIELYYAQ